MTRWLAFAVLVGFGLGRLGPECGLGRARELAFPGGSARDLELRERIGQSAFVAALSGFRSLVASLLWVQVYVAWSRTEWGRVHALSTAVTTLQPRVWTYWDTAAWHLAWNASVDARRDPALEREALRRRAERQYWDLGRAYLERGIRHLPASWRLHERLGFLWRDKYRDPCAASEQYDRGSALPGAPPYLRRFAAYELAECPGREREAYARLRALYVEGGVSGRKPTLLTKLRILEDHLDVSPSRRLTGEN